MAVAQLMQAFSGIHSLGSQQGGNTMRAAAMLMAGALLVGVGACKDNDAANRPAGSNDTSAPGAQGRTPEGSRSGMRRGTGTTSGSSDSTTGSTGTGSAGTTNSASGATPSDSSGSSSSGSGSGTTPSSPSSPSTPSNSGR
jgi:hypothetical protein